MCARDPRCPASAFLTVQAVGDASVVRWRQQVVQGHASGDGLVCGPCAFRGAAAGPGSAGGRLGCCSRPCLPPRRPPLARSSRPGYRWSCRSRRPRPALPVQQQQLLGELQVPAQQGVRVRLAFAQLPRSRATSCHTAPSARRPKDCHRAQACAPSSRKQQARAAAGSRRASGRRAPARGPPPRAPGASSSSLQAVSQELSQVPDQEPF